MPTFWVKANARLHLGQLDLNGSLGRIYGGLGLAIDQPHLLLSGKRAQKLEITGVEQDVSRARKIAQHYLEHYALPGAKIELQKTLPWHSGLGSGTQLSLAIGFLLTRLYGLSPSTPELASLTDREGSRSGIGVAVFDQGGFIVDGGKIKTNEQSTTESTFYVPPVTVRLPFPENWRIIVAIPKATIKVFGKAEVEAFQSLPPMSEAVSGRITRHLLMQVLPSLLDKDIVNFGQGVTSIQSYLGEYFTPVQNGSFSSDKGAELAEFFVSQGVCGIGQSSWGPTVYGFVEQDRAEQIEQATKLISGPSVEVFTARGSNQGVQWGWNQ